MTGLSANATFTVGGVGSSGTTQNTSITAKFLLDSSGNPIVDPVAGGSQNWNIYVNGTLTTGLTSNPNNWLIVPANYTLSSAASVASSLFSQTMSEETGGIVATLGTMAADFAQNGSQDLQRGSAWGIPTGLVVPAFTDAASFNLGLITNLAGLPLFAAQAGGGVYNTMIADINAALNYVTKSTLTVPNTGGSYGLSVNNAISTSFGFQYANTNRKALLGQTSSINSDAFLQYASSAYGLTEVSSSTPSSINLNSDGSLAISTTSAEIWLPNFAGATATCIGNGNTINCTNPTGTSLTLTIQGTGCTADVSNATINAGLGFNGQIGGSNNLVNLATNSGGQSSWCGVWGTNDTFTNDNGIDNLILASPNLTCSVSGNGSVTITTANNALWMGSSGLAVTINPGLLGNIVVGNGAAITLGTGAIVGVYGSDTINVGSPANFGNVNIEAPVPGVSYNADTVIGTNLGDGTKESVYVVNTGTLVIKQSSGYTSAGKVIDVANYRSGGQGQDSIEYFNPDPLADMISTNIIFNSTTGAPLFQVTQNLDNKAILTVFQNSAANVLTNSTYLFSSDSLAMSAGYTDNYSSSLGSFSVKTGSNTVTQGPGVNIMTTSDWVGASDPLSGDKSVQWYNALPYSFSISDYAPYDFGTTNTSQAAWNKINTAVGDLDDTFIDPLVLNLVGQPVTTTDLGRNGVYFDTLGDDKTQQSGWIASGEAFLVEDPGNGGSIDSGSQLISSLTQLAGFDTNGDGEVSAAEASSLRVWVPGAQGGLYTLGKLGISEIDLSATSIGSVDHGNEINSTFSFIYRNGAVGQGADVTLEVGPDSSNPSTILPPNGTIHAQLNGLIAAMASFAPAPGAQTLIAREPSGTLHSVMAGALR